MNISTNTDTSSPISIDRAVPPMRRPAMLVVMYSNPDYHPPTVNGVHMMSEHFDVRIVCRNDRGPRVEWPPNVNIERVGSVLAEPGPPSGGRVRGIIEFFAFERATRRAAAAIQPAAIYAYDAMGYAVAARIAKSYPRACLIFHSHELAPIEGRKFRAFQPWVVRYALKHTCDANLVVFPSAARARVWMAAARDARSALIVPNASSVRFYRPRLDFSGLIEHRFANRRAAYLGVLGPNNGIREAICAMAQTDSLAALELIGSCDANFRTELTSLARSLDVDGRVDITGWLPHPERRSRLDRASVGLVLYQPVNPNWEHAGPSPNKLFEYGAMGLPVVIPDLASYREFFGSAEWIVYANPADPESIARAIDFVLGDRDRYMTMSVAARKAHEDKYNYETVFAPVLKQILALADAADSQSTAIR